MKQKINKINLKNSFKSIRVRLFATLCFSVIIIIVFLILTNNIVLESFYLYSKQKSILGVYHKINNYYKNENKDINIELELEKEAINNSFDILIKNDNNISVYSSNKNFLGTISEINKLTLISRKDEKSLYKNDKIAMNKVEDPRNGLTFLLFNATLDNSYILYIRMPVASIHESVKISNKFLYLIGAITIIIGGILGSIISNRFTTPILELNEIAKKMSKLDFTQKYETTDSDDEINNLGKSINTMSDTLEKTIKTLKQNNIELEKDIEEKSKIDEMRTKFIQDVSHELKTPIALIQGYSEGLIENINKDEESKKFYASVILDEANKMDNLVKELLELMKLEYGKREFNNIKFNITELIKEIIRKSTVMLEENNIKVEFDKETKIIVNADPFYIEQVITNYLTNAIKNVKEINREKLIRIETKEDKENNLVRISVFNSGDNIEEENLARIWNRFYKIDESRNRQNGGTGIGLSVVKAIMNNYKKDYGVVNKENGVEFYFDLDLEI